jgi:hypothetical protein
VGRLSAGDLTALEAALAPDAKWRAIEDVAVEYAGES